MKKAAVVVIIVLNVLLFIGSVVCVVMTCRNNKLINSIEQTYIYREDSGRVILTLPRGEEMTLLFEKDSVKILSSYELQGADEIYQTVMFVRGYARQKGYEIPRSITEMYGEIRLHNMLYALGYKRENTGDCDLDYASDRRWYVNVASKVIGWIEIQNFKRKIMKELPIKLNKKYYNIFKDLTDKQTGELVKAICAYAYEDKPFITRDDYLKGLFMYIKRDIDISRQNSSNGKRAAAVLAERKRNTEGMLNGIGVILGKIITEKEGAAGGE